MKGAAFAAFGEMAVDLMLGPVPLVASNEGVKLGDSTFSLFFRLVRVRISIIHTCWVYRPE